MYIWKNEKFYSTISIVKAGEEYDMIRAERRTVMTTYNICGKKVTMSDKVEKIYLDCFPELPPDFVIRGYIRACEGPDLIKGTEGTPLEKIVAKHSEKELSDMLDESILSSLRDIYDVDC